jgi:AcrR family transcriptional regulator
LDLRAERGEATRQHIVAVATRLFAERGYEPVSIEAILSETGMSRGSLYHHFAGKEALFTAALESTEARIAATVAQAAQGFADPLERLRAGCNAWLDLAAADIAVRQIALIDAPSVLGWEKWREIDSRHAFGLLRGGVDAIASVGTLPIGNAALFAHALLAILSELSLVIARSPQGAAGEARAVFEEMLDRLLTKNGKGMA